MKPVMLVLLLIAATSSLLAADRPQTACAAENKPGISMATAVAFPTVALNQARPRRVAGLAIDPDVLIPPPENGGGWTAGACNCKRFCSTAPNNCKLTSDAIHACKSTGPGTCESCTVDCGL